MLAPYWRWKLFPVQAFCAPTTTLCPSSKSIMNSMTFDTENARFVASKHPAVMKGHATVEEVQQELLDTFFSAGGGESGVRNKRVHFPPVVVLCMLATLVLLLFLSEQPNSLSDLFSGSFLSRFSTYIGAIFLEQKRISSGFLLSLIPVDPDLTLQGLSVPWSSHSVSMRQIGRSHEENNDKAQHDRFFRYRQQHVGRGRNNIHRTVCTILRMNRWRKRISSNTTLTSASASRATLISARLSSAAGVSMAGRAPAGTSVCRPTLPTFCAGPTPHAGSSLCLTPTDPSAWRTSSS